VFKRFISAKNITLNQCFQECHPCQLSLCSYVRYTSSGQTITITYYLPSDTTCTQSAVGATNLTCGSCIQTPTTLGTCPLCVQLPVASHFTCNGICSNNCNAGPPTPPPTPAPTTGTPAPTVFAGTFLGYTYCGNLNCTNASTPINFTFNVCAYFCNPCNTAQCTYLRPTLCAGIVTIDYYLPTDTTCSLNRIESQSGMCSQCKPGDSIIGTCPFCLTLGVYSLKATCFTNDLDICQPSDTGLTYGGKIAIIVSLTVGLFAIFIILIIAALLYYFYSSKNSESRT